jgi:hypothetical protein
VPGDNKVVEEEGGLAKVLHDAVTDPTAPTWTWCITGRAPIC